MNILVTGANGFIGSHLVDWLSHKDEHTVISVTRADSMAQLIEKLSHAEMVFHLAGVNRPENEEEFITGNINLTEQICATLQETGRSVPMVLSSSTQAEQDNAYGRSKQRAEEIASRYATTTNARVAIYRLPGVFGKWSRPNYNTVVATFCHNIARDLPITISDPAHQVGLVYIDDVMQHFMQEIEALEWGLHKPTVEPVYQISLDELAEQIRAFRQGRETVYAPGFTDPFVHKLYATYLSFLESSKLSYKLEKRSDPRGSLAEFIKLPAFGQIFVSRTKPGITRGDHYHHTKTEKFLVLEGKAMIRFRHLISNEIIEYPIRGEDYEVVDIPPGYTHSIENTGNRELVTLFWASEVFNPKKPDTYYIPVLEDKTSA